MANSNTSWTYSEPESAAIPLDARAILALTALLIAGVFIVAWCFKGKCSCLGFCRLIGRAAATGPI